MTEIYIYEHEAIRRPKSENNIGAPKAPQKDIGCIYLMLNHWTCVIVLIDCIVHAIYPELKQSRIVSFFNSLQILQGATKLVPS